MSNPVVPRLRSRRRPLVSAVLGLLLLLGVVTPASAARERQDLEWVAEQVVLDLHNQARAQRGLTALAEYRDIREVARGWSDRQASNNALAHNPNYTAEICCATSVGENVGQRIVGSTLTEAAVRETAADLHRAYMDSPAHRDNVVRPQFTQVGVGVSLTYRDGYWRLFSTVDFRAPDGTEPGAGLPSSRGIENTCGTQERPSFTDVTVSNIHAAPIACIEKAGITSGKGDGTYGVKEYVSRGQIASFLMRTLDAAGLDVPPGRPCTSGPHSIGLSAMREWGIFTENSCDDASLVTRVQMAAWSVRALQGPMGMAVPAAQWDYFTDDNHLDGDAQGANNAIADWGVVTGVGNDKFSPDSLLRRDQMATFLARLLDAAVEGS